MHNDSYEEKEQLKPSPKLNVKPVLPKRKPKNISTETGHSIKCCALQKAAVTIWLLPDNAL
ncbi:hypothetical protein CPT77_07625 [Snodgrassella alvi]|nr:hypothetical protein CPT77_07625 [Snodgrassella alvi]